MGRYSQKKKLHNLKKKTQRVCFWEQMDSPTCLTSSNTDVFIGGILLSAFNQNPILIKHKKIITNKHYYIDVHVTITRGITTAAVTSLNNLEKYSPKKITYRTLRVMKKAQLRNRYYQVPHLTQNTILESDKTKRNITHTNAKRSAFFPAGDHQTRQYNKDKHET